MGGYCSRGVVVADFSAGRRAGVPRDASHEMVWCYREDVWRALEKRLKTLVRDGELRVGSVRQFTIFIPLPLRHLSGISFDWEADMLSAPEPWRVALHRVRTLPLPFGAKGEWHAVVKGDKLVVGCCCDPSEQPPPANHETYQIIPAARFNRGPRAYAIRRIDAITARRGPPQCSPRE